MKWYKRKTKGKHTLCFGFSKVFRGFGFMVRVNDPYALKQFVTLEFRLLWIDAWYAYERNI
jgi:hypothetical protein